MTWLDSYVAAGMPPAAILRAMTANAVRLLGLDKERGALKQGMAADLIATMDDPLVDIGALKRTVFVMKDGRIVRTVAPAPGGVARMP
jgi:imidazolonepropionase-like amidohydrolase